MKNPYMWIVIVVIIGLLFLGWKYLLKTGVENLSDGVHVFKRGGKYFQSNSGVDVEITESEYNKLIQINANPGDCVKPSGARLLSDCVYYSPSDPNKLVPYKGYIDDCGNCRLLTPFTKL